MLPSISMNAGMVQMANTHLVRFDWAIKYLLRNKAYMNAESPAEIFPEYYLIKVDQFRESLWPAQLPNRNHHPPPPKPHQNPIIKEALLNPSMFEDLKKKVEAIKTERSELRSAEPGLSALS